MPHVKTFWIVVIAVALLAVWYLLFKYLNAAKKLKALESESSRLEAELKEKNILLMQSQIQPHFIYNTLATIQRMCLKNPEQASELVRNFSLYLQANFRAADSLTLIPLAEELKHVGHY